MATLKNCLPRLAAIVSAAIVATTFCAAEAAAQHTPTWQVNYAVEVPVLLAETALASSWFLGNRLGPPYCSPRCDSENLWGIDRFAAGWYRPAWSTASDISILTLFGGSLALVAVEEGFVPMLQDAVVILEAVMGALTLSSLTNFAVDRPRPHLYGDNAPASEQEEGRAGQSFFSGHTASAFAAVLATFQLFRTRRGRTPLSWGVLGGGLVIASFIGTSRVLAGQHFPTDVLAGAAVGSAFGMLVPALHRPNFHLSPGTPLGGLGATLSGRF